MYRVYKNKDEFLDLAVSSAQEAIAESKITDPMKIKIIMPKKCQFFQDNQLEEIKEYNVDISPSESSLQSIETKDEKNNPTA